MRRKHEANRSGRMGFGGAQAGNQEAELIEQVPQGAGVDAAQAWS